MTEAQIKIFRSIDQNLEAVKTKMYERLGGDEGNDIGDAIDVVELICNTCDDDGDHDSYDVADAIAAIADAIPDFDANELHAAIEVFLKSPGDAIPHDLRPLWHRDRKPRS